MKIIYSPKFLSYHSPGHPESPQRLKLIHQQLKKDPRFKFITPQPATQKDLLRVHTPELIDSVKNSTFTDLDTPNLPGIFNIALLSAGAALQAAQISLEQKTFAFSLARPPGHHAGRNFLGGFCYFNNLAIAVASLLRSPLCHCEEEHLNFSINNATTRQSRSGSPEPKGQLSKVAILDLDAHHGNGTQDIFLGNNQVLFCSLHQSPLYPGSGLSSSQNCHNFPLQPGTTSSQYLKTLNQALTLIQDFHPHVLAVSLGFDTYQGDPLANLDLDLDCYLQIGQVVSQLNLPTFFSLEGGYSPDIGQCAWNFFTSLLENY